MDCVTDCLKVKLIEILILSHNPIIKIDKIEEVIRKCSTLHSLHIRRTRLEEPTYLSLLEGLKYNVNITTLEFDTETEKIKDNKPTARAQIETIIENNKRITTNKLKNSFQVLKIARILCVKSKILPNSIIAEILSACFQFPIYETHRIVMFVEDRKFFESKKTLMEFMNYSK